MSLAASHESPARHPLSRTVARLRRRSPWMDFGFREDVADKPTPVPPWDGFRYGSLLEPAGLDQALDLLAAEVDGQPRVTGTAAVLLIGWASRTWMAALLVDSRVPLATLAEARTNSDSGSIDGSVILPHGRFACLPADPTAAHPDALVVSDQVALRGVFHEVVTDALLAPLIDELVRRRLVGRKALGGMVGSRWASTAEMVARGPAERCRMRTETTAVIRAHALSRAAAPVFYEVPRGGGRALAHWRGTCCLYYQLPDVEQCAGSCPLTPDGRIALQTAAGATQGTAAT